MWCHGTRGHALGCSVLPASLPTEVTPKLRPRGRACVGLKGKVPGGRSSRDTLRRWGGTCVRAERGQLSRVRTAQGLVQEASGAV